jgi:peptidyl-prolyl cis-trans isomerase D
VRAGLEIPAEELRAYYDANSAEFTRDAQVRAQHIVLYVTPLRTAEQAIAELEQLKARAAAGEDFQQLAREHSEDDATKAQGGDLGFFGRGQMQPPFEAAAFAAELGIVVGPVENQLGPRTGYHLIKVLSRDEGGVQPFEQVEGQIRLRLLNERAPSKTEELANALYDRIKGRSDLSEETLRGIAVEEDVGFEVVGPFGVEDTLPALGRSTAFHQLAFSLEPGTLSEPTRVTSGWALLDVLEVQAPREPELAEVETEVRAAALREKRQGLASERAIALVERLRAGADLDAELGALGLSARDAAGLRHESTVPGLPAPASHALVAAALTGEEGAVGGPIATEQGVAIFQVVAREHFDPATLASQSEVLRDRLVSERVNALLGSLIEQRVSEMDVNYTRDFVEAFEVDTGAATDS